MLSQNQQNTEETEEDRAKARESKFKDAIVEFEKVTSDYSGYSVAPEALYYTANCYYHLNNFQKAKELYTQFISSYPDDYFFPAAHLGLAYCQEQEGDEEAAKTFEKIATTSENQQMQVDAYLGLARNEEMRGNKERAIEIYEKIIKDFPDNLYGKDQATGRLDALKLEKTE
jgi:TolA-binding protein